MTDDSGFDTSALDRTERMVGAAAVREIIDLFLGRAPGELGKAIEASQNGDLETSAKALHSLQSSAAMLGATDLLEHSRKMYRLARDGDAKGFGAGTEQLKDAMDKTRDYLEARRRAGALPRIALVEDNPDNTLLVRALLEDSYEVDDYDDGESALEGLGNVRADLILLDISLPRMSGSDVLRKIRSEPELAGIPVVALTAHAMSGDRERFAQEGFDGYIAKPITDERALIDTIEKLLRARD